MPNPSDDLEAVRTIVAALESFKPDEQRRIVRWSAEKLGLSLPTEAGGGGRSSAAAGEGEGSETPGRPRSGRNIRSFVSDKNPTTDNQFAATVAYYYRFEAPESERKDSITAEDLQEACRRVGRRRLNRPSQTLVNAHTVGLLDKAERGSYTINAVGENLVAMTLPSDAANKAGTVGRKATRKGGRSRAKRPSRKTR